MPLVSRSLRVAVALLSLSLLAGPARAARETDGETPPERVTHEQLDRVASAVGARAPAGRFGATSTLSGPVLAWSPLGPAPISFDYWSNGAAAGRVSAVAIDPRNGNTVYIAAAGGGVWKTTDGGAHWSVLTDALSSIASGALAIDPQHPDTVFYATGELHDSGDSFYGDGLFRTLDGGVTWNQIASRAMLGSYTARIAVHATNPSLLYVAGSRGFMRSVDGGVNWTPTLTTNWCYDLVVDPTNNDVVYTAAYSRGVYKSVDAGQTWIQLGNGIPFSSSGNSSSFQRINLAISPSNPQVLYASFVDPNGLLYGMFKTADGGATWSSLVATPDYLDGQGWYDNCLIVDPTNSSICYAGGVYPYGTGYHGVIRTGDGGASWVDVTIGVDGNPVHPDQHIFAFGPGNTLWVGNDGGVWKTNDGGQHWIDCNGNLAITQFYAVAPNPTNPNAMIGGTQDNGSLIYSGAPVWDQIVAGDGGQCLYLWNDPSYYFTTYVRLTSMLKFQGSTFIADVTGPWDVEKDRASFLQGPFTQDYQTANTLLAGTYRVWRSGDAGASWDSLSGDLAGGSNVLRSLAVAAGAPNTIYAGTSGGRVWVTTDASLWNLRNTGLPGQPVNYIRVSPADPQTAYLVSDTPGGGRVWLTTNSGTSWTDVSGNLPPGLRGFSLAVDWSTTPPGLYVGTDYGVYRSADGGSTWIAENVGLPNLAIYDLELAGAGTILAATHGRGIWRGAIGALATDLRGLGGATIGLAAANPVRPPATIDYTLPARDRVSLVVYDVSGRAVRVLERGDRAAGVHRVTWDGRDQNGARAAGGVYFYRLKTTQGARTLKVALIR